LQNCKKALRENGRILLYEILISSKPNSVPAKIMDIEILVGPGGRERTREQFAQIFESTGMKLNTVIKTKTQLKLIEAVKDGIL